MSLPTSVQFNCPRCGEKITLRAWESINTQIPDVAKQIMSRELFAFTCPKCKLQDHVDYDMLYNDMEHDMMIQVLHYKSAEDVPVDSFLRMRDLMKGCAFRIVHDNLRLAETVTALEYGRDDRLIELCKWIVFNTYLLPQQPDMELDKALYAYSDEKKMDFISFYGKNGEHLIAIFDENLEKMYSGLKDIFLPAIEEECADRLIFDYDWAGDFALSHMDLLGGDQEE